MNLVEMRNKINNLSQELEIKKREIKAKKDLQISLEVDIKNIGKARELILAAASITQENVKFNLSNIVNLSMKTVLKDPPKFVVDIVTRRNQTEIDLLIEEKGIRQSPLDSVGGGAIDIIAFALRISLWLLKQSSNVFILDEPFRNVSHSYQEKMGQLLKILSEKMEIQFILISHQKKVDQFSDRVFQVSKEDYSIVEVLR